MGVKDSDIETYYDNGLLSYMQSDELLLHKSEENVR